jgi:hypothetical protein
VKRRNTGIILLRRRDKIKILVAVKITYERADGINMA